MANIYKVARHFRDRLYRQDDKSLSTISSYYRYSLKQLVPKLEALHRKIEVARSAGEKISEAWLQKEERYKELIRQTEEQLAQIASQTTDTVTKTQDQVVRTASEGAKALTFAEKTEFNIGYQWNRIPKEAFESLVGFLGDGSPLRELFDALGKQASESAKKTITDAVLQGFNPRKTAKLLKEDFDNNAARALTVARTEQMRSYRTATSENYKANSDVVEGWTRIETLDEMTCIICIVEHGKQYENEDDFETHPNCRGTMIPNVKGRERDLQTGEEWFDQQSPEKQQEILGDSKYEAWKNGEIDLASLVERTEDERWGGGRRERSLDDAKEAFQNRDTSLPVETEHTPKYEPQALIDSILMQEVEPLASPIIRSIDLMDNLKIGLPVGVTPVEIVSRDKLESFIGNTAGLAHTDKDLIELSRQYCNDPSYGVQTTVHEIGHMMDAKAYHNLSEDEKVHGLTYLSETEHATEFGMMLLDTKIGRIWTDDSYYGNPTECFARFTEQYTAVENKIVYERGQIVARDPNWTERQRGDWFDRKEYESLKPLYEALLEKGKLK